MDNKGLGETAEFCSYHPLVNITYFALVVGITMFSISPYFLAVTMVLSWSYAFVLKGTKSLRLFL